MDEQIRIVHNLPLPKDIKVLIIPYVEQSIPLYRHWANLVYDDFLLKIMGDKQNIYNKDIIIKKIIQELLDKYGENINILLEQLKKEEKYSDSVFMHNSSQIELKNEQMCVKKNSLEKYKILKDPCFTNRNLANHYLKEINFYISYRILNILYDNFLGLPYSNYRNELSNFLHKLSLSIIPDHINKICNKNNNKRSINNIYF